MTCKYCGNEIRDDAKFCPHCGAVSGAAPEAAAPPAEPEAPAGGGKRKGLLIAGVAAAVVLVAVLAAVAGGLFSNPKRAVEAAAVKSAAAYAQASEGIGLPDLSRLSREQSYSQSLVLGLNSVNSMLTGYDMSALSGLGLRMDAGVDIEDRKLDFELAAFWNEEDLIRFLLTADDAELYFSSPQITGETCYGVNTETLGADLTNMTGDRSLKDLSFNLFDLADLALEKMDQEKLEKDMKAAARSLWDQAEVKKTGSNKTHIIHGTSIKTTAYQVTIPQEALDQYVDDLEAALSAWNYSELYQEMFRSMGMPQEAVQDFLDELEGTDPYGKLADGLRRLVDGIGDLTLDVRLSGGYVSGVLYEDEIDGHQVNAALLLGGGTEYVDDLALEFMVDDLKFRIDSTGDHSMRSNLFADTTTVQLNDKSSRLLKVTSDLTLDPAREEDNLRWKLGADSTGLSILALDAQGTLYVKEDLIDLTLEDAALSAMGMEICSLRFNCRASCCPDWLEQPMENARLVTQMDRMELMMTALEVRSRAEAWASETQELFRSRLPAELYAALFR